MIFDGITLHNFGVYLGRQEIRLSPENEDKPIILFGGLNGVGKTTLLDAFQLGLFGKLANCSNRGTIAYDKYLKKCIHRSVKPTDGAAITIRFRHTANGIERRYQITRSWQWVTKNVSERIEVLCNGKTDYLLTDAWNEYVEQFIPIRISNLFFFDGEKIKDLADFKKSSELIATGINQLLGLDLVDRLITDLKVLEKKKTLSLSDHQEQKEIEKIENEARELYTKRDELWREKQSAEEVLSGIEQKIKVIDEQFRSEGGDLYREHEIFEYQKTETDREIAETKEKLIDLAAESLPLILVKPLLQRILAQSKEEETAKLDEQITGKIQERDKKLISELKRKKISEDVIGEIELFLQKDIKKRSNSGGDERYLNMDSETIDALSKLLQEDIEKESIEADKSIEDLNNLKVRAENLDRKLALVPDAESLAKILEKKENLLVSKRDAQLSLAAIENEYNEIQKKITTVAAELEREYGKALVEEENKEADSRIIYYSNKSRSTLEIFQERVVDYHLDRIQKFVLYSFKELLRKETLVSDIRFDPKTFRLEVIGSDNQKLDLDRLSAGEKQILSISLLWGLAQASGKRLPTIIDTPLGRLDTTHRTHLVKRYFPNASHQVLLLSTDEEINEKYYRMIRPWVSKAYRLEFDDSKQTTTVQPGYFW